MRVGYNKMKLFMHRVFVICSLFLYVQQIVLADWQSMASGVVTFPPHVYKIRLNYNQTLRGLLSWPTGGDLDIYLYKQTSNIIDDTKSIYRFTSNSQSNELLLYTSPQYKDYYVRVYPYRLTTNQIVQYNITLTIGSISVTYSGAFHQKYLTSLALNIPNTQTFSDIAFTYWTNNSQMVNTALIGIQNYFYNVYMYRTNTICRNSTSNPNQFIFIIQHNIKQAYSLTHVSYNLHKFVQYAPCPSQCGTDYFWNESTQSCTKFNTVQPSSNTTSDAVALISILVPVFVAVLVILALILFVRKCRKKLGIDQNKNAIMNMKINDTEADLKIQDNCCICLGEGCNVNLPCNHFFHKKCIKEWLKKSRLCPLCRIPV